MSRYSERGYASRENLYKETESSGEKKGEPTPKNGVVKGIPYLRLRSAPGNNEETLKIVQEGTKVEIINQNDRFAPVGFIKVKLKNDPIEYWTRSDYIK